MSDYRAVLYDDEYLRAEIFDEKELVRVYAFAPYKEFVHTKINGIDNYEKYVSKADVEILHDVWFALQFQNIRFSIDRIENNTIFVEGDLSSEQYEYFVEHLNLNLVNIDRGRYAFELSPEQAELFYVKKYFEGHNEVKECTFEELLQNYLKYRCRPRIDQLYLYIRNQFNLSEKVATNMIKNLSPYYDIMKEMQFTYRTGRMVGDKENPVRVEGYSAKDLLETGKLSPLGAYNYLVYLREEPKKALADLKAGLPRK